MVEFGNNLIIIDEDDLLNCDDEYNKDEDVVKDDIEAESDCTVKVKFGLELLLFN